MWVGRAVPVGSHDGRSLGGGGGGGDGNEGKGRGGGGGSRVGGGLGGIGGAFIWTWNCAFSFRHRDSPIHTLSSSLDGSLLAVGYDNVVTLWDPVSVMLRTSLIAPGVTKHKVRRHGSWVMRYDHLMVRTSASLYYLTYLAPLLVYSVQSYLPHH